MSSIVPPDVYQALAEAVHPSAADVIRAKAAISSRLKDAGSCSTNDIIESVLRDLGAPGQSFRPEHLMVPTEAEAAKQLDYHAAPIVRPRLEQAVKLALAELAAEGLIVPADAFSLTVYVQRAGHSGGEQFPAVVPQLAGAYGPARSLQLVDEIGLLDADLFTGELGVLLNVKARRCLYEALSAARRGLYLSAVNLIGAVSEAAWYALGEALRDRDEDLAAALDANQTSRVQQRVASLLSAVRRQRTIVTELQAHAAYLRDLRNYGVHPVGDVSTSQEHAFTEAGCFLLLMQTHRYLVRLLGAANAAGADLSAD